MFDEELARHTKRKKRVLTGILAIVAVLAIAVTVFFTAYITSYRVEGNIYVEDQEIVDQIFASHMEQRFFYAWFKNLTGAKKPVESLSDYSLRFSPDLSVTVTVTENSVAGAVSWQGSLYYFDKNGFVMAADIDLDRTVPIVEGLAFEGIALYSRLDCGQTDLVDGILQLTQLLSENGIEVDSIFYDENAHATIRFGDIRVTLGSRQYMTDKIAELKAIIDSGGFTGLKGTLHLESFTEGSNQSFIFDRE